MATVYLLGDWDKPNVYKIGVTRGDVYERIKKLQTGNSGEIYLVDSFQTPHPFLMEKNLHQKFSGEKVLNEWFELDHEQASNFKEYCQDIENMFEALKDNYYFKKKYGSTN